MNYRKKKKALKKDLERVKRFLQGNPLSAYYNAVYKEMVKELKLLRESKQNETR